MKDPLILTYTGRRVNPLDVRIEDICIEDIAHHLSLINRFNGATRAPVSVAQHAVYVSHLLEGTGYEWQGLHHDDGEAYVGDVTRWLKKSDAMVYYRKAEERAQFSCFEFFGVTDYCYPGGMHPLVQAADKLMVRFEGETMMAGWDFWIRDAVANYPPITPEERTQIGPWWSWTPEMAESAFLVRFRDLRSRRERGGNEPENGRKPVEV